MHCPSVQCEVCNIQWAMSMMRCDVFRAYGVVWCLQSTVCNVQWALLSPLGGGSRRTCPSSTSLTSTGGPPSPVSVPDQPTLQQSECLQSEAAERPQAAPGTGGNTTVTWRGSYCPWLQVGDSLLEPFWPEGTGVGRGFLGVLDTAWMISRSQGGMALASLW